MVCRSFQQCANLENSCKHTHFLDYAFPELSGHSLGLLHGCCTYAVLSTSRLHSSITLQLLYTLKSRGGYEVAFKLRRSAWEARGHTRRETAPAAACTVSQSVVIAATAPRPNCYDRCSKSR
jgi:hypothetical protein